MLRPQLPDLRFRLWAWFSTVFTFIAMYVGAFVSSTGAGGRFQGWPLPAETYQVAGWAFELDVLHRTLALLLVLNLLLGVRWTWQFRRQRPDLFRGALTALICVCLQALSGMLLIATSLSIQAFLTHVTIVTGLFASMCYLSLQVCGEPIRKKTTHLRAIHGGRQNASTY
ncbi:hypothetical protein GCM10025857_25260 [Alicyclobacillus contaminans]|nr:hypothetical protein GCM10025857_25260 [Alicyclobacillus contaminans]